MSNMNFSPHGEQSAPPKIVVVNGERFIQDPVSNLLSRAPSTEPSYQPQAEDVYAEVERAEPTTLPYAKERRRPKYSLASRLWMGSMVVGAVVLPPAAHVAAEYTANSAFNFFDQRPDRAITPDNLIEDIGVTINKLGGDQNG